MLKFIITSILLLLVSKNLFSQKVCEESFQTHGIFKTPDPKLIIIASYAQLKWYNVETCEFVDSLVYNVQNSSARKTRISEDGKIAVVRFENVNSMVSLRRYNLETKQLELDYDLKQLSQYATRNGFMISHDGGKLLVLSGTDQKISEYDLITGELIRFTDTPSLGLSHLKVSSDGSLIGVYSSGAGFDKVIYLYESESLELITSIPFTNYFDESDLQINSGFEFDPITNDIYLGSSKKLIKYNFETEETRTILEQYRIRSSNMNFSEDGETLFVDFKPDGVNTEIGVVNVNSKDDFYTLPGFSYWAIPYEDFVIVANGNFTNNIFKLGLTTGISYENENLDINVYPNPSSGNINISFNTPQANPIALNIYTMEGELIQELYDQYFMEPVFNKSFDIGSNPSGAYLIEIQIGENKYVENIILER